MSDNNIKLPSLQLTGERYLPEVQGSIELEHLHRYLFAKQFSLGKRVLDIASGEGYGSALLAQNAASVVGVDIAPDAVAHATTKYQADNLEYRLGSCAAIPLADHSVDVVVSFETIEHHYEHDAMMHEIKRVLIPGGLLVISSPDKLEYSDRPSYNNPFHVKELYRGEFTSLLEAYFKHHYIAGQRLIYGSAIFGEDGCSKIKSYDLSDKSLLAVPGISRPLYLVGLASDVELPLTESGILEQPISESDPVHSLNQALADRDGQIVALNKAVAARDQQIAALHGSNSWRITKPLRFVSRLLDMLPNNFDRDVYLKLNPDVAESGGNPATHYLLHGRREGRICSLPDIEFCADRDFKADRETILIVSHEASRTGAPVVSLNLVIALVERYNVVALLLGGGPLSDAFRHAATVVVSSSMRANPIVARLSVDQLCERFSFKFALVNSIESRTVLPSLSNYFVPAISLIHEFASYTRPREAFRQVFFWSGEVVFSASVTLENALAEFPDLCDRSAHILPQGRCLVPLEEFSEEQLEEERNRIRGLIRPKGIAGDTVIILGAGFVELRKGVDLFIECAARVVRTPGGGRCRFVWIGKGYDPENDVGYSVYLADQIRRAGLEGHVLFVDETTAIETAYEEADLLLLSSRLDPLPNVAIDAMAHGLPVLCFNKTTGIADFLLDSGLGNHCVADYLDSADLAGKILTLAGAQVLREHVGDRCREASIAYFSMKEYVARLEGLAQGVCNRTQQEKTDTQMILSSGLFRRDFSRHPHLHGQSIEAEVRGYVRAWASGIDRRKPFPGFHPGIYLEQHGLATQGADPFADYLRAGKPEGPWNYRVIVAGETREKYFPSNQRIALHLHVYYPELLPEIITRLSRNRIHPDLFVSITNEKARKLVVSELKDYKGNIVDIQLVPNRGRDIGPFLTAFGQRILVNYDFIGHIHTKKSADVKDAAMGESWYRFLLGNLLGGESGGMADSILAKMKDDPSIGMVFPDDPTVVGWGANRAFGESLAERVGFQKLPEYFIFPVGTMFWARTSALAPLINLRLDWDDYPKEPLPYDGTPLHALERLFSLIPSLGNFSTAVTNEMGLTR